MLVDITLNHILIIIIQEKICDFVSLVHAQTEGCTYQFSFYGLLYAGTGWLGGLIIMCNY